MRPGTLRFRAALALLAALSSPLAGSIQSDSRLVNLSTRALLAGPADQLLVGLVVAGDAGHPVLLRAVGPALARFGIAQPLADPVLRLLDPTGAIVGENDNWRPEPDLLAVSEATGAFALEPGSRDAALLTRLPAGDFVAHVPGETAPGLVLVEAYDADPLGRGRLMNLSTRGPAGPGDAQLIAGFVIAGAEPLPLLVRAIGPTLTEFDVAGALADPVLTLWNARQEMIAQNDNWGGNPALAATFAQAGAFALPPGSFDSALALTLEPGNYSVQVAGAAGTRGESLVEIYTLLQPPGTPAGPTLPPADADGAIALFNGRNLDGLSVWSRDHGHGDPTGIFTVQDGLLRVAGEENYAALTTEAEYSNYVLTLEFKWGPATYGKRARLARDAGILLHCVGPQGGWRGRLQPAVEVQVLEGGMGDFILLKDTESPPGRYPMSLTSRVRQERCRFNTWNCRGGYVWDAAGEARTFSHVSASVHALGWDPAWRDVLGFRGSADLEKPPGEWNQFVVIADGDRLEVYFNGAKVNEATQVVPARGRIGLESELAEYFVRRWEVRPLAP